MKMINSLTILAIYTLIGHSSSLLFLKFGQKSLSAEYQRLKDSSVYRGVLLSFSTTTKYEFCEDIFGAQLFVEDNRKPFRLRNQQNKFDLLRHKISIQEDADAPAIHESLHTICGPFIEVKKRRPMNRRYDYSTAYRSKWFYITDNFFDDKLYETGYLRNFVTQSPDHVHFKQASLEQRYMNTQKIIMTLREESPKYIEVIGKRDNLSNSSNLKKMVLCASILSTRTYRAENLEWSLHWSLDRLKEFAKTEKNIDYERKTVQFKTISKAFKEEIEADCILCQAFKDGTLEDSPTTNLYLTRTYENGDSLLVLKEEKDGIFLQKYFKNIAELMTTAEEMNFDGVFSNFTP